MNLFSIINSCEHSCHRHFQLIVLCVLFTFGNAQLQSGVRKKFEYKLSFKGPHLVQKDGTVPFWEHYGHAIASDESIRITPSLKSKKGSVWSKDVNPHDDWEIEVVFRVSGRGRIGADGLAVWYTQDRGQEGPVFGSSDNWKGLGVFFDSFDNDGLRNNPYILAMVNDGTKSFEHDSDGSHQQLGGCLRDFRNKPFPVRAKIEYYKKALTIYFHNGLTNNKDDYELCVRAENIDLPKNGFFGVSAATGGLADDHDVFSFLTSSLHTQTADMPPATDDQVTEGDRQKFEKEFDDYRQKLEQAKQDYKKDHPVKPGDYVEDDDKLFEPQELRELKMILDGQNEIYRTLKLLVGKLDEVVGRQERELSMLTLINQQNQGSVLPSGQQIPVSSSFSRQEIDGLVSHQKELNGNVRDVKLQLNDIQTRLSSLTGAAPGQTGDKSPYLHEMKTNLDDVQNGIRALLSKAQASSGVVCPTVEETNCVTPFYMFLFLLAHLLCIIGYFIYRSTREAAAKKFY